MAALTSVPILLLTGFLGSGKTSLLARWLKAPEFAGAMVIVNELGEVGIDDRLVESSTDTPVLLDNGCACCAAGEDLTATLERLFWDRLHRKIPKFSWVLIETTGVADPAPILDRLARHSLVSERYHVEGVVTTFDARLGAAQLAQHPECVSQLEAARAVVITKTDIASPAELGDARAAIASVRRDVSVLTSSRADLSAASLIAGLATNTCECGHAHHDHDHADGDHVHAVHSAGVSTAFVGLNEPVDAQVLKVALMHILAQFGPALLRLKGITRLAPAGNLHAVQAMPGQGIEFTALASLGGARDKTGLTIIAQAIPAQAIADALVMRMNIAPTPPAFAMQQTA